MKIKTKKIKDDEIAKLASMLQAEFGVDLAHYWNSRRPNWSPRIYDSGDCRGSMVAVIKKWVEEMGRNED